MSTITNTNRESLDEISRINWLGCGASLEEDRDRVHGFLASLWEHGLSNLIWTAINLVDQVGFP